MISLLQVLVVCLGPGVASVPHRVVRGSPLHSWFPHYTIGYGKWIFKNYFSVELRYLSSFRIHNRELFWNEVL